MRPEPPTIRRLLEPRIVKLSQLAELVYVTTHELEAIVDGAPSLYSRFEVPKPDGSKRLIQPPSKPLRQLQRSLLDALQNCVRYPCWMMGGVPRRSIFQHAKSHVGKQMVATFDVKAFYPSTNSSMVQQVVERLGFGGAAADAVVRLVTKDNQLPQGSPASSFLANLVLEPADRRIHSLCRRHELDFTRYVDDIAISGDADLTKFHGAIVESVRECGYQIASEKVHYMKRNVAQLVTKLRVNDKLRPTREFIADVKAEIWDCLHAGPESVAAERGLTVQALKQKLSGRVSHIRGADEVKGAKLRRMLFGIEWSSARSTAMPVYSQ